MSKPKQPRLSRARAYRAQSDPFRSLGSDPAIAGDSANHAVSGEPGSVEANMSLFMLSTFRGKDGLGHPRLPATLPATWRSRAEVLRAYGAAEAAATAEQLAAELDASIHGAAGELLTIAEAAKASGYSPDHLRRQVRQGKVLNHGKAGRILVRIDQMPRKAALAASQPVTQLHGTSRQQVARSFLNRED